MKNISTTTLIVGILGIVVGAVIMWFVNNSNTVKSNTSIVSNIASNNTSSDQLDRHFIEQMIPHHQDAITMAESAIEKAQKSEIKNLAQNIIEAQDGEINQMKDWYKSWYGVEVQQGSSQMGMHGMMGNNNSMHMGMMGNESDLEALNNAEDFDKTFIELMIPHHQMAVMMATMLENGTTKPELKQLAKNIIEAQNKEIVQMREWYREWGN